MFRHLALATVAMLALPMVAQAQDAQVQNRARANEAASAPRQGQPAIKGNAPAGTGSASSQNGTYDAADDALANQKRTNSQAATSGAVNSRNALAPAGAAVGPAGTPVAGGPR